MSLGFESVHSSSTARWRARFDCTRVHIAPWSSASVGWGGRHRTHISERDAPWTLGLARKISRCCCCSFSLSLSLFLSTRTCVRVRLHISLLFSAYGTGVCVCMVYVSVCAYGVSRAISCLFRLRLPSIEFEIEPSRWVRSRRTALGFIAPWPNARVFVCFVRSESSHVDKTVAQAITL